MGRKKFNITIAILLLIPALAWAGQKVTGNLQVTGLTGSGSRCVQTDASGNITAFSAACGSGINWLDITNYSTGKALYATTGGGVNWSDVPATSFANPTASVGLSAVNGSASTSMRSDGAPALSQAIVPTWSGVHTFTPAPIFSAMTAGSVLFAGTSGLLSQNNSNFFWNNASTAMGIGTSSPIITRGLPVVDVRGSGLFRNIMSSQTNGANTYYSNAQNSSIAFGYLDGSGVGNPYIDAHGSGSIALGFATCSGTASGCADQITASGNGSLAGGYSIRAAYNPGEGIFSTNSGSFAWGYLGVTGNSSLTASGTGSVAFGAVISTSGADYIKSTNNGSFSFGTVSGNGRILSSGNGSLAGGYSNGSGSSNGMNASNYGSIALGAYKDVSGSSFSFDSTGVGSVLMGMLSNPDSTTSNTHKFISSGSGSVVLGASEGILQGTGKGSVAIGYSSTANTLQSTGTASVAIGQDVQATANNAMTLGSGLTNSTASSLAIGFGSTATITVDATNVNMPGLTASTILSADASKNIISLATATYPSLTELSYVKGVTSAIQTQINTKGAGTVTSVATGTGLTGGTITTTGTISSNAVEHLSYQPGLLTAVNSTIGVYYKASKTSTVDNIVGSAVTFSCISNPTVTMYECGTSATCSGPTTIGTVTVTASGQAFDGSISSAAITAGDYIGWAMTAGTCASIDIAVNAQIHSN